MLYTIFSEWSKTRRHMVHDELVPMDFTTNTLQIRTDNYNPDNAWNKWIFVQFFETEESSFGGFRIDLGSNPPSWEVFNCNSAQRFSDSLPASSSRIWTVGWDADNYRFSKSCGSFDILVFPSNTSFHFLFVRFD